MAKEFKFGASFNCYIMDADVSSNTIDVGGAENGGSLDYVSDDLDKIEQVILEELGEGDYTASRTHKYVGFTCYGDCSIDGDIVSVILDDGDVTCVIFANPSMPTIVE